MKKIAKSNFDKFKEEEYSQEMVKVTVVKEKHQITFSCEDITEYKLKIWNYSLEDLYDKYKGKKVQDNDMYKDVEFLSKVYLLLFRYLLPFPLISRYNTTDGDAIGNQMALPKGVFDYLKESYGLECECFASPFNSYSKIGKYCSQFEDTDTPFGSLGSFFNFEPKEGVFECNPPFVEEYMIRNIDHVQQCLDQAEQEGKSLMFFIIVPAWKDDCKSYNLTKHSKYLVFDMEKEKRNSFYRNGMAHQGNFTVMSSGNASLMFVLQTSEAKKKIQIDKNEFIKEVGGKWSKDSVEYKREFSENRGRKREREEYRQDYSNEKKRDNNDSHSPKRVNIS